MLDALSPPTLSWGVAGYGWVARDFAAPGMRAAGHRVAAIADPDPQARRRATGEGARARVPSTGPAAGPAKSRATQP